MRTINKQCKSIIKQNDRDVRKKGLDKEHAGVDVWAKSLAFIIGEQSLSEWIDAMKM